MKYLQDLIGFYKNVSYFGHQLETGAINRSFSILQDQNDVEIPFVNIKINIFHVFKLLSKIFEFTSENDDFVTLIYDFDKRLIRESLLINLGSGEGIIKDVISDPIPEDFNIEGEDSNVFQSVTKFIQTKYSVQIGRLKIIDARLLESIMELKQHQNENKDTISYFFQKVELFLNGCKEKQVRVYPEMPLLIALKRLASATPNSSTLLKNMYASFESDNVPVTFFDDEWYITILRKKNKLIIPKPFEFDRVSIHDHFQWKNFVKVFNTTYSKKHSAKSSYFIDINWCIDYLSDLCESEFPLSKARFEYLMQRLLYFISQNEKLWDVVPRPIMYNGYIRLLTRLLGGFHINPRKLSYWSIPTNFTQFIRSNYGPNDQVVFLITENNRIAKGLKMRLEKGVISEVIPLDYDELDLSQKSNKKMYNHILNQLGFTKSIVYLEKSVLTQILKYILIDRNSKNPFRLFSGLAIIGKLNNKKTFRCYPELPWYWNFKKTRAIQSFRKLNRLLYDFLEF